VEEKWNLQECVRISSFRSIGDSCCAGNCGKAREFYEDTLSSVSYDSHLCFVIDVSEGPEKQNGLEIPNFKRCNSIIPTSPPCAAPPTKPSGPPGGDWTFQCPRYPLLIVELPRYTRAVYSTARGGRRAAPWADYQELQTGRNGKTRSRKL